MAKGFTYKIEGLNKLLKSLDRVSEQVKDEVDFLLDDFVKEVNRLQTANAPINEGGLRQGNSFRQAGDLQWVIFNDKEYSPFVEFGTGRNVKVPAELSSYASQFRNQETNGTQTAKEAIYQWCKRRGIDEKDWFSIYISIMVNGIKGRPFFFEPYLDNRKQLIKDIANALKRL